MIKVLEAFDHEQGSRSRVIFPDRCPAAPLRIAGLPCQPPSLPDLSSLAELLDRLPDPRRIRGRRYRLGALLVLCLLAILGGATTLAGITRFAVDSSPEVRARLGSARLPHATTLGRLLSRTDGDALDDAVGAWLERLSRDPVETDIPGLAGLAVDGKAVRGSRDGARSAVHLLAAVLHEGQAAVAQRQIAAKSNEIPAFAPLLERLDLHRYVITADAMHTQTRHAEQIRDRGGHYILIVKGSQKNLRRQMRRLPWRDIPLQHRIRESGHGRREIRRLKVCTVQPGLREAPGGQVDLGRQPIYQELHLSTLPWANRLATQSGWKRLTAMVKVRHIPVTC